MEAFIKTFLPQEAASSIILIVMTVLAMAAANSPAVEYYSFLQGPRAGLIINDGLMTLFFLIIGIEIRLNGKKDIALPLTAALGGVVLPAIIFLLFNWQVESSRGWAIPTATDIAFVLGILTLFGKKIPYSLRLFVLMIAIFDDIAATIIIAGFYSGLLYVPALCVAVLCVLLLYIYQRSVIKILPYLLAGAGLWIALFDSGIHPALSGVVIGILLPVSISTSFLQKLHPWVAYLVVPIFVFAHAGINLNGVTLTEAINPLSIGIFCGLFVGKQLGIFIAVWSMIKLKISRLPHGCNWSQMYGISVLCGMGFTMSLFIGRLAFEPASSIIYTKIGVIAGSLASAILASIIFTLSASPGDVLPENAT